MQWRRLKKNVWGCRYVVFEAVLQKNDDLKTIIIIIAFGNSLKPLNRVGKNHAINATTDDDDNINDDDDY